MPTELPWGPMAPTPTECGGRRLAQRGRAERCLPPVYGRSVPSAPRPPSARLAQGQVLPLPVRCVFPGLARGLALGGAREGTGWMNQPGGWVLDWARVAAGTNDHHDLAAEEQQGFVPHSFGDGGFNSVPSRGVARAEVAPGAPPRGECTLPPPAAGAACTPWPVAASLGALPPLWSHHLSSVCVTPLCLPLAGRPVTERSPQEQGGFPASRS